MGLSREPVFLKRQSRGFWPDSCRGLQLPGRKDEGAGEGVALHNRLLHLVKVRADEDSIPEISWPFSDVIISVKVDCPVRGSSKIESSHPVDTCVIVLFRHPGHPLSIVIYQQIAPRIVRDPLGAVRGCYYLPNFIIGDIPVGFGAATRPCARVWPGEATIWSMTSSLRHLEASPI